MFQYKNKLIKVEWAQVVIASLISLWAVWYDRSTCSIPDGGKESVFLIHPLAIILLVAFLFVLKDSITITAIDTDPASIRSFKTDRGFLDRRRLTLLFTLIVYCVSADFFGYFIPSILAILFLGRFLGFRRNGLLIVLSVLIVGLVSFLFAYLLKVPIPIWPL